MSLRSLDTETIVRLVLQDAEPSLGARAREEALRLATNYSALALEWIQAGETLDEAQRSFDEAVVDGLQQTAHDLFWDTMWPACPRHARHPLWYDGDRRAWCCDEDSVVVALLGRLAQLHPPAT